MGCVVSGKKNRRRKGYGLVFMSLLIFFSTSSRQTQVSGKCSKNASLETLETEILATRRFDRIRGLAEFPNFCRTERQGCSIGARWGRGARVWVTRTPRYLGESRSPRLEAPNPPRYVRRAPPEPRAAGAIWPARGLFFASPKSSPNARQKPTEVAESDRYAPDSTTHLPPPPTPRRLSSRKGLFCEPCCGGVRVSVYARPPSHIRSLSFCAVEHSEYGQF